MHISYKPLWHTLLERDMRKEDLRLAAGMTTNMIANMSKVGKHISMDTLARTSTETRCLGGAAGFLHIQTEVSQFGIYFEIPTRRHLLRST